MKSKLQFGHVAASLPLSPSRQKSRLVQRLKVHQHPQLLDRCGVQSRALLRATCGSEVSIQPSWYLSVSAAVRLWFVPVVSLNKKLSISWNFKASPSHL